MAHLVGIAHIALLVAFASTLHGCSNTSQSATTDWDALMKCQDAALAGRTYAKTLNNLCSDASMWVTSARSAIELNKNTLAVMIKRVDTLTNDQDRQVFNYVRDSLQKAIKDRTSLVKKMQGVNLETPGAPYCVLHDGPCPPIASFISGLEKSLQAWDPQQCIGQDFTKQNHTHTMWRTYAHSMTTCVEASLVALQDADDYIAKINPLQTLSMHDCDKRFPIQGPLL